MVISNFFKLLFLFFCFALSLYAQDANIRIDFQTNDTVSVIDDSYILKSIHDSVVDYSKTFLNTPYRFGAQGASSFDCSGFTSYVYRNFGFSLKHSSSEQAQQFESINKGQLKKGDLVFFSGRKHSRNIGHVGIVVAAKQNGEFDFIHAAVRTGVVISNSEEEYYRSRYVKAARVVSDSQLIARLGSARQPVVLSASVPVHVEMKDKQRDDSAQSPIVIYHEVSAGETLFSVAAKYNTTVDELKALNSLISNKVLIKQRLLVPVSQLASKASALEKRPSVSDDYRDVVIKKQVTSYHIVDKGETLFSISKRYDIPVDKLIEINQLTSNSICVGQKVFLEPSLVHSKDVGSQSSKHPVSAVALRDKPAKRYKVQSGENLTQIARTNNVTVDEITAINNFSDNTLRAGQEILIPVVSTQNDLSVSNNVKRVTIGQTDIVPSVIAYHEVRSGDNLKRLAEQYDTTVDEIIQENHMSSTILKIGEKLRIPSGGKTARKHSSSEYTEVFHQVDLGESCTSIAKKYHCTIADIKIWNNKSTDQVKVGERLVIHQQID